MIDIVFHPETIQKAAEEDIFREFISNLCIENIQRKYGLELSPEVTFPKLKYKGKLPPKSHHIKKPAQPEKVSIIAETTPEKAFEKSPLFSQPAEVFVEIDGIITPLDTNKTGFSKLIIRKELDCLHDVLVAMINSDLLLSCGGLFAYL